MFKQEVNNKKSVQIKLITQKYIRIIFYVEVNF